MEYIRDLPSLVELSYTGGLLWDTYSTEIMFVVGIQLRYTGIKSVKQNSPYAKLFCWNIIKSLKWNFTVYTCVLEHDWRIVNGCVQDKSLLNQMTWNQTDKKFLSIWSVLFNIIIT